MGMFCLQDLGGVRIVENNDRACHELGQVVSHPECDDRNRNCDVREYPEVTREVKVSTCVREVRFNQPEEIEGLGEDHPSSEEEHLLAAVLEVAAQKAAERDHPMEDEVAGGDHPPSAMGTVQIPGNLFRRVGAPDDQELRECQVDIQHDEAEHKLAEIVLLRLAQDCAV